MCSVVLKGDSHRGHPVVPVGEGWVNIEMQMGTPRATRISGDSDDSTSWATVLAWVWKTLDI